MRPLNGISRSMLLYYGPLMTFQLMEIYLVGVQKENWLAHIEIEKLSQKD